MAIVVNPVDAWRLHDPYNPVNNIAINVIGDSFNQSRHEEQAVMQPVGRRFPIVVADILRGWHFEFHLEFMNKAEHDAFENIKNQGRTLQLYRNWTNEWWWIRLGETEEVAIYNSSPDVYRTLHIDANEVDPVF